MSKSKEKQIIQFLKVTAVLFGLGRKEFLAQCRAWQLKCDRGSAVNCLIAKWYEVKAVHGVVVGIDPPRSWFESCECRFPKWLADIVEDFDAGKFPEFLC